MEQHEHRLLFYSGQVVDRKQLIVVAGNNNDEKSERESKELQLG